MKKTLFLLTALAALFVLGACKKEVVGPQGPPGPPGPAGSANVKIHTFESHDFVVSDWSKEIIMTDEEYEKSTFFVTLKRPSNSYPVPGFGYMEYSEYRTFIAKATGRIVVFVSLRNGSGEDYDAITVTQIIE